MKEWKKIAGRIQKTIEMNFLNLFVSLFLFLTPSTSFLSLKFMAPSPHSLLLHTHMYILNALALSV